MTYDEALNRIADRWAGAPPTQEEHEFLLEYYKHHVSQRENGLKEIIGLVSAVLGGAGLLGGGNGWVLLAAGLVGVFFGVVAWALDRRNRDCVKIAETALAAAPAAARLLRAEQILTNCVKTGGDGRLRQALPTWNAVARLICLAMVLAGAVMATAGAVVILR